MVYSPCPSTTVGGSGHPPLPAEPRRAIAPATCTRLRSLAVVNTIPFRGRTIMPERVWDRFLTEQDRSHLAMSAHRRIGFGNKPALLLIDLYRWVFGDRPEPLLEAIKTWPGSCGLAAWQAIPHLQTLLKAAR